MKIEQKMFPKVYPLRTAKVTLEMAEKDCKEAFGDDWWFDDWSQTCYRVTYSRWERLKQKLGRW